MKIYKYATLLGIALCLGSCANFLEMPSETTLGSAIYYKSQGDFEQAINGAYEPLRSLYAGEYGSWSMGEMRSDNTTYKYSIKDRGRIRGESISDFVEDPDNLTLLHKWDNNYAIISRVNHLLEPIDNINFDEEVKSNIKGQAYFLRAFAYFDLVQYFGEVPLYLKPVSVLEETALPLSSVEDIYKQVIDDAILAMKLPDKATQEAGRATSGSARMLLANAYINQKRWEEAETVLKGITGYDLLDNYEAIYDPNQKNHQESIFEIQYKEGNEGYASGFLYQFIPEMTAEDLSKLTGGIPQSERTWQGYNIPTPDILETYEANDVRKEASIGTLQSFGETYPYIKKYHHGHAESGKTNDNWPVYRYAETLLFLAECANEQNNTTDALGYLNRVRKRAGLGDSQAANQTAIREAIWQERRVELAFENKRWLDLVRSGKAEGIMKAFGERVKANPAKYYFPAGYSPSHAAYVNIPLIYALPAQEVVLNPNLKK